MKVAPLALVAFNADRSAMSVDDLLGNIEPKPPATDVIMRDRPLESLENPRVLVPRHANAEITDDDSHGIRPPLDQNIDWLATPVFHRIRDQFPRAPGARVGIEKLKEILGLDQIAATGILSETTADMSHFKDERCFAAWAGVAAGKKKIQLHAGQPAPEMDAGSSRP